MNTHSDGLYGTLSTLCKRKTLVRFGVSYASCGPSSCQGGMRVSEREDVVSLSEVNFGPQLPHASSFIKPNNNNGFTTKEENDTVIYSLYKKERELSSHGLNISPMKQIYITVQCVAI